MAASNYELSTPNYKSNDDLFESLLSEQQPDPSDQFSYEIIRISTFHNWPSDLKVRPPHLAKAGFFYRGNSDEVMCYECKIQISNWSQIETRRIHEEHLRVSPHCSMAQSHGNANTNVPMLTP